MANEEFIQSLVTLKAKSEDDFEKNINWIAAGTLVLSLTFIDKIVPLSGSIHVWALILSWILQGSTLLVNLISHQVSTHQITATIRELRSNDESVWTKAHKRNKIVSIMNWYTTFSLTLGIAFLILFCSINAYKKMVYKPNDERRLHARHMDVDAFQSSSLSSLGSDGASLINSQGNKDTGKRKRSPKKTKN